MPKSVSHLKRSSSKVLWCMHFIGQMITFYLMNSEVENTACLARYFLKPGIDSLSRKEGCNSCSFFNKKENV